MTYFSARVRVGGRVVAGMALMAAVSIGTSSSAPAGGVKPPAVRGEARDFTLPELGGDSLRLSDLTKEGPVVLVVLRGYPGYQCPICTRQFGEFLGRSDDFAKVGATVLFVYPGPAEGLTSRAAEFVKGKDYPRHFRILLDPDYVFTNAYGLRWNAPNETSYPSTFVIDGKRRVTFAKVSKTHGDRASAEDLLKALRPSTSKTHRKITK